MFVHKLLPKLPTKNGNSLEYVKTLTEKISTERIQQESNDRGQKHNY